MSTNLRDLQMVYGGMSAGGMATASLHAAAFNGWSIQNSWTPLRTLDLGDPSLVKMKQVLATLIHDLMADHSTTPKYV